MQFVDHSFRVRYAETDRMGYVYYGNYAQYFEVARVEALRKAGVSYKDLEDEGVMLPVVEFNVRYRKPAFYDDEIVVRTYMEARPDKRIAFRYETLNKEGKVLNEAFTKLVFVDTKTGRPVESPAHVADKMCALFGIS